MPISFNTNSLDSVQYNGADLDVLKLNGVTVWERYSGLKGVILQKRAIINNNILSGLFQQYTGMEGCAFTDPASQYFTGTESMEIDIKFTTDISNTPYAFWTSTLISFVANTMSSSQQYYNCAIRVGKNNSNQTYIGLLNLVGEGQEVIYYTINDNTTYWIKFINYPQIQVLISTDGVNYTNIYTNNNSLLIGLLENCPFGIGTQVTYDYNTGEFVQSAATCYGTIDLSECFIKSDGIIVWKGVDSGLQRYTNILDTQVPVLLHMDANVTNNGSQTLSWSGQGFLGSSTGGKFNGYNMYAGWYDFSGLTYSVSDDYTIEMWMKTVEYTDNYNSFTWGTGSGPTRIFTLELNNKPNVKELRLVYSNGADTTYQLSSINEWTHIAVTYKGGVSNGTFTLFINGIKKTSWSDNGATSDYNTVFNGNSNLVNLGYSGWDEFVVHDYIRYTRDFELQTQPYNLN